MQLVQTTLIYNITLSHWLPLVNLLRIQCYFAPTKIHRYVSIFKWKILTNNNWSNIHREFIHFIQKLYFFDKSHWPWNAWNTCLKTPKKSLLKTTKLESIVHILITNCLFYHFSWTIELCSRTRNIPISILITFCSTLLQY